MKKRSDRKRLNDNLNSEYAKLDRNEELEPTRIEDFEFENRGIKANLSKFWSFMKSGSHSHTSIVA